MEKKNVKNFWLSMASGLSAFAVGFMLFCDAVTLELFGKSTSLSFLDLMFGYEEKMNGVSYEFFGFSFMMVLTLLIALAGLIFLALSTMKKAAGKKQTVYKCISIGCFAVSGVLCFFTSSFVTQGKGLEKFYADFGLNEEQNALACKMVMNSLETEYGAVACGILLLGAGACCVVEMMKGRKQTAQEVATMATETAVADETPAQNAEETNATTETETIEQAAETSENTDGKAE